MIPIKQGEFKIIQKSEVEKYFPTGIYRAKIHGSDSKSLRGLFRFNSLNKYTNIDLKYAQSLGLTIELIEDGKVNALLYTREKCKTGAQCFKEFVDMLYKLRENPIIRARCKALLRCLWGSLCQRDEIVMVVDYSKEHSAEMGRNPEGNIPTFSSKKKKKVAAQKLLTNQSGLPER
jgi:hypothetical protein